MDTVSWKLLDTYFKNDPYNLVAHQQESYDDFFDKGIFNIFRENNPVRFVERRERTSEKEKEQEQYNQCDLYLGGKDGTKIYFGKPILYDDTDGDGIVDPYPHYMYPNDARLRNMTYGVAIHYDVEVDYVFYKNGEEISHSSVIEKVYLGKFPIMVQSKLCILRGMAPKTRFSVGECLNDWGGYFIIDGKEKVIMSQEKFGDNMLYVKKHKEGDIYNYSCEVRSVSDDTSKQIRHTSVRMVSPSEDSAFGSLHSNSQLVVDVPNVKKPIPLFILMRALGVVSDKSIIEHCLLNLEANADMVDLFIPSIHQAGTIFTQEAAIEYIKTFTKRQTSSSVFEILMDYFLPHVGESNYLDKAYYIGNMVMKLLLVSMGRNEPTNRDNFKYKRVEVSGTLIHDLFREYYLLQKTAIQRKIDKEFYYHQMTYKDNFVSLVEDNIGTIFEERLVERGFQLGFKGNWGATANTKKIGLVQPLDRLSWFSFESNLRKIILPLDATAKVVGPHLLHNTQWGIIDPVDTPDGGNIGLHKYLAISSKISTKYSPNKLNKWLRDNTTLKLLQECTPNYIFSATKIMVNGRWIGVLGESHETPMEFVEMLRLFRRNGVIPLYTSISFHFEENTIFIYTDGGRLTRPIFYKNINDGEISYNGVENKILDGSLSWVDAVTGVHAKGVKDFSIKNNIFYHESELYPNVGTFSDMIKMFEKNRGIIDYVDVSEEETAYIANSAKQLKDNSNYTHAEIDTSLIFGIMGNSIIFPDYNQFPRDLFSCGQSRQAVSVYHTNYPLRMDKAGFVLNYGQIPLIKSRYLEYINNEEHPYGVNAVVAIMSYTGYNVEDAILINEGSINRGMFRTSYFTTYEEKETHSNVTKDDINAIFTNIHASNENVEGLKPGYDYSKLDQFGLVKEGTIIDDNTILIGKASYQVSNPETLRDGSKSTKRGQLGSVDKTYLSQGTEGYRIAKIRICENRSPRIGDKLGSRAGQKGTCGLIIPEQDMPFMADGTRPDLIINPHALPSRMTIGQLVESLLGKACAIYGGYGDCTAFSMKGSNYSTFGHMLTRAGYHHSGNQIMYNGFTGEQIYSEIYIGMTYYMRLKHMTKDKLNFRGRGPRTALTRQTVQGRANEGGLRIGEMERDGLLGHGMSGFVNESFMVRGDEYYMAICNQTGNIAVYNPSQKLFLSPSLDGPLKFNSAISDPEKQILETVSAYGRSFSIVRIPYTFKLLLQELQAMNIQMRVITADNIEQMDNMSYRSRTIDKLLEKEKEFTTMGKTPEELAKYNAELDIKIGEYLGQSGKIKHDVKTKQTKENILRSVLDDASENVEHQIFTGGENKNVHLTIEDDPPMDFSPSPSPMTLVSPTPSPVQPASPSPFSEPPLQLVSPSPSPVQPVSEAQEHHQLDQYFNVLPEEDKLTALETTFEKKAEEFKKKIEEKYMANNNQEPEKAKIDMNDHSDGFIQVNPDIAERMYQNENMSVLKPVDFNENVTDSNHNESTLNDSSSDPELKTITLTDEKNL